MGGTVEELMLEGLPFFPHDSDARRDPKIRRLLHWGGMAAYGRWWCLCEYLAYVENHIALFNNDVEKSITAAELETTVEDAEAFLGQLALLRLIDPELWAAGKVCNERMVENAQYRARKQAAGAKGGRPKKQAG